MALGTNQMTVTTGSVFRPNVWSKELLIARENNLVLANLVHRYDRDIQGRGQTVEIPNVSNITANAKVANTQVTLNAPTETKQTITINNHYESSFLVEDPLDEQAAYDIASAYSEKAGYALAAKVDNTIANDMTTGFTNTVGAFGTPLSDATILSAIQTLDNAAVPMDNRVFVVTGQGKAELLNIDKYVRYDAIGVGGQQNAIKNGQIGSIYGLDVYMSQNIVRVVGSPNQNNHLMFHKDAYGLAMQKDIHVENQRKAEYLGDLYVASALWGGKVVRVDHGVLVKS